MEEILDQLSERAPGADHAPGLEDGINRTLEDVGREFNVTRERAARSKPRRWQVAPSAAQPQIGARLFGVTHHRLKPVADMGNRLAGCGSRRRTNSVVSTT
ncbi:MAG: hypothetical protein R2911_44590 [Caldilineaceae bacterium]